jgi:uncharacterized protein
MKPMEPNNHRIICLYHWPCLDGQWSAWAVWQHYPNAEFYRAEYGKLPQVDVTDATVYLVDFVYDPKQLPGAMIDMMRKARKFVMIDHHINAIDFIKDKDRVLQAAFPDRHVRYASYNHDNDEKSAVATAMEFNSGRFFKLIGDTRHSGAVLTWLELSRELGIHHHWTVEDVDEGKTDVPMVLRLISDHDRWKHLMPDSREVAYAFDSLELSMDVWKKTFPNRKVALEYWTQLGHSIGDYRKALIKKMIEQTRREIIMKMPSGEEVTVPLINVPKIFTSDALETLYKDEPQHPFVMAYYDDSTHRIYSLRSDKELGADVQQIALLYKGGGHPHASGIPVPRGEPLAQY